MALVGSLRLLSLSPIIMPQQQDSSIFYTTFWVEYEARNGEGILMGGSGGVKNKGKRRSNTQIRKMGEEAEM